MSPESYKIICSTLPPLGTILQVIPYRISEPILLKIHRFPDIECMERCNHPPSPSSPGEGWGQNFFGGDVPDLQTAVSPSSGGVVGSTAA